MTHSTPKDPEGSVSKSRCCEKCEYSHRANKGHRGFCCECVCHLPPAAEKKSIAQKLRDEGKCGHLIMTHPRERGGTYCAEERPCQFNHPFPKDKPAEDKCKCDCGKVGIAGFRIEDKDIACMCFCHGIAEESGESSICGKEHPDGGICQCKLDCHLCDWRQRDMKEIWKQEWNADLVKELESMKRMCSTDIQDTSPTGIAYNQAIDSLISELKKDK